VASRLDVVIIEDNDALRDATVAVVQAAGHDCTGYFCAEDMDQTRPLGRADVYVVDLNLPGEDGFQIVERLRRGHPRAGIIMFTARTAIADRVKGYGIGADVYMTKPVEPSELCAAISALGRRVKPLATEPLSINLDSRLLVGSGGQIAVTASEALLLSHFASAPSRFLEHWQVMSHMFREEDFNRASLDVRMSYLRKKLISVGATPPAIQVVHRQGYRLLPSIIVVA
jgi:DNA-binding response OmpR family regulator